MYKREGEGAVLEWQQLTQVKEMGFTNRSEEDQNWSVLWELRPGLLYQVDRLLMALQGADLNPQLFKNNNKSSPLSFFLPLSVSCSAPDHPKFAAKQMLCG